MRFKRIVIFLFLNFLLCETSFLYGQFTNLINIGSKFKIIIEDLNEDAKKIRLTEERLRTVVELRLRKEGIIITDEVSLEIPIVLVSVTMVGSAYSVTLMIAEMVKLKRLPPPHWTLVSPWVKAITGTHIGDPEQIVSSLNRLFDIFLNDYYKANPKENQRGEKTINPQSLL